MRLPGKNGRRVSRVWEVAATTGPVTELAAHLVDKGVEKVTVESTSDYWRIWVCLLEAAGLDVQLVNARDVKNVPGRPKTDKLDSVWLAKLTEKGMLRPSFVPPAPIRQLRDYTRLRTDLTRDRSRHVQRLCQYSGTVLAQLAVGAKTNEIPMLRTLLDRIDITGAVITADALHCQRETAEAIVGHGGDYILTVKANQPTLHKQLKALPWKQVPILDRSTEHGHGRTTKRTLKTCEIAAGIGFPHAVQVLQLTRTVTDHKTKRKHTEVVYALTSLSVTDATPQQIAGWLRGHWTIEVRLHWVRDVTYGEDHSQIRTELSTPSLPTNRERRINNCPAPSSSENT